MTLFHTIVAAPAARACFTEEEVTLSQVGPHPASSLGLTADGLGLG